MKKKSNKILKVAFYILLIISLLGTIILFVLNSKLSKMTPGSYVEYVDLEALINKIYSFVFIENIVLYISCLISVILIVLKKKINLKNILIILFAVLSSATIINLFENVILSNKNENSQNNIFENEEYVSVDKPMLYIYPVEDMDLTIKLSNEELIKFSYPKYDDEWNVFVTTDGNIYDYKTKRNYYGLFWEGIYSKEINYDEGFIVKGNDMVSFLEEKLAILGLNDREINEFIVFWLPKLEKNEYNFIRFCTEDEINNYMPLEFSTEVDTIIRVYMEFVSIDEPIEVKEQSLTAKTREGFTVVEWAGIDMN